MKKILIVLGLMAVVGCMSLKMVAVRPEKGHIRESAYKEFPSAVQWAADCLEWQVQRDSENVFFLEKKHHGAMVGVEVSLMNGDVVVQHKKSEGFRYSEGRNEISLTYSRIVLPLVEKIANKCNAAEMPDMEFYKSQYKGIDAKGLAETWANDRRQMYRARTDLGMKNSRWINQDGEAVEDLRDYEARERLRGATMITNGVDACCSVIDVYCASNRQALANNVWSNYTAAVKLKFALALAPHLSTSNIYVLAGNGDINRRMKRVVKHDEVLIRRLVRLSLKRSECSSFVIFVLDNYQELHIGFAGENVLAELKDICKKWEYDRTPAGKREAKLKEVRGPEPKYDFEQCVYELMHEDDHGYRGKPRGLKALGKTEELKRSYNKMNETALKDISPRYHSMYLDRVLDNQMRLLDESYKYEQEQVAIGLQQALAITKRRLKDELVEFVISRASKNYTNYDGVTQEDVMAAVGGGISARVDKITLSFDQALERNAFSSSYAMESAKKEYLKDVAVSLANDLRSVDRGDFVWQMGENNLWQSLFLLGMADAARLKAMGRAPARTSSEDGESGIVTGTGWFVGSNVVITCQHVVENGKLLKCRTQNGLENTVKCVALDKENDLAVLEVEKGAASSVWLPIQVKALKLADKVCTFGYPLPSLLGQELKYTDGSVSGTSGIANDPRVYQISVPLQPGNSGGALLNDKGFVVGITSSGLNAIKTAQLTGSLPQNVNYAIKVRYLTALLEDNGIDYATDDSACGFSSEELSERAKATVMISVEK